MNSVAMMANIICIIVVVFVAVAFLTLAVFYFKAQKKLVNNGLEDEALLKQVRAELQKCKHKFNSLDTANEYFAKCKRMCRAAHGVMWGIFAAVYIAVFAFIIFSTSFNDGGQIWMGNTAMMIIETDSMASANTKNDYLFDNSGTAYEKDRIFQFTFITISNDEKYIDELDVGDIAAFLMTAKSLDGKEQKMTVVHRLVGIDIGEDGEVLYTFRGDANPSSMAGEYQIGRDRIVGVFETENFKGEKNLPLGYFVTYLRSSTGIAMCAIAFIMMVIYLGLSDKMDKVYDEKINELKLKELEEMFDEQKNNENNITEGVE